MSFLDGTVVFDPVSGGTFLLLDRSVEVIRHLRREIEAGKADRDTLVDQLMHEHGGFREPVPVAGSADVGVDAARAREQLLVWVDLARRLYT